MAKSKNQKKRITKKMAKNSINRAEIGYSGVRTKGEQYRGRSLKADHKRSIAVVGGYPDTISLRQHYDMANRNGIGNNLAYSIVDDTWRVWPTIYDGEEDAERRKKSPTEFEQAIDKYFKKLHVWDRLKALDKAQRPMRYGALMFVTQGEQSEKQSPRAVDKLDRQSTMDYLAKINVFHEAQLPVTSAGTDPSKLNYAMPLVYDIKTNVAGSTNEWENSGYQVDASRIFAYGEGALDGSIYGEPCNEACFEALMDAQKTRCCGSEGLAQNSSNKYAVHLAEGANAADANAMAEEMEAMDNDIGKSILLGGGTISTLQTSLFDPTPAWTIAINECAAKHSKPMSIIIGQMTGVLASGENIKAWNRVIMDRQEQDGNGMIIGLIDYLTEHFSFPSPQNEINIVWRDLNESTAEQQVDLAVKRTVANKNCVDSGMLPIFSTETMQSEAGAPIEKVILLDTGGETDDDSVK